MDWFESPLFTDILLIAIYVMIAAASILAVWSMVRSAHITAVSTRRRRYERISTWVSLSLLVVALCITALTADIKPIAANGRIFEDTFWLRATGMFIYTSLILIVVAAIAVIISMSGISRRKQ